MAKKLAYKDLEKKYEELRNRSFSEKLPRDFSPWYQLLRSRVLDNLPAGVAILDNEFILRELNRTYSSYLQNYSPFGSERSLGMCYFDFLPGSQVQLEDWFRETRDLNHLETRYDFELRLEHDSYAKSTYWDADIFPLLEKGNKAAGIVIFCRDVTNEHRALETINRKKLEIESLYKKLEDYKAGIRVLLDMREESLKQSEEKLTLDINYLVLPLVARLKKSRLGQNQHALTELIESTLADITSGFSYNLNSPTLRLTPREILVAGLIKAGKTSKEIAEILLVSLASIEFHRNNIRRKLGLTNKKENLRSYLSSF